jgi:hypothetical protein
VIRLQATPRRWQNLLGHAGRYQIELYYIHIDGTAEETFERNGVRAAESLSRPPREWSAKRSTPTIAASAREPAKRLHAWFVTGGLSP